MTLSRSAQSRAARRGGHVFVWGKPFGGMELVEVNTTKPERIHFDTVINVRGISVHLANDVLEAKQLAIRCRRWWPGSPLTVDTGFRLADESF